MTQLELAVAIPSFIGSLTSCLATTIFAVLYYLFPPERHFRQALVVNLLLAGPFPSFSCLGDTFTNLNGSRLDQLSQQHNLRRHRTFKKT